MNKELSEFLTKFNSISESPSPADYQTLINFISNEIELSSKIYKALDCLQTKLLKNPIDIETNYALLKNLFTDVLASKNKNLFDFIMSWLITLYYKLEDKEKEILLVEIFLENIFKNNFAKSDLVKKINIEENYYYKLIRNKIDSIKLENLQRIFYLQDCLEKKSGAIDKSKELLIKNKNKKFIENIVKGLGRTVLDYYIMMICYKIKTNPNKIEIDSEKYYLKTSAKYYSDTINYFFEISLYPFNASLGNNNARKFMLFINFILLKTLGLTFLDKFFKTITNFNFKELSKIFKNLDFSILEENFPYSYQNIDTSNGYTKTIENLLYEMIGTHNLKFEKETTEINESKIIDKFKTLKSLIILIEKFTTQILNNEEVNNINPMSFYTFYYSLQLKFIKNFVIFQESHKKKFFEIQVNIGNIAKVLPKYNNNYQDINLIFSEIISLFYQKKGTSLIFPNWLTFIFKNGTILDAYKALRIFLLTKKEGGQIYSLLKMNFEVSKYYSNLWQIVLNSFLIDSSNRNSEENLNLMNNLKFIFYYEISLKSTKQTPSPSDFYDSLSYDTTVIIKFFREKFSILSSIFFHNENLIENMISNKESNLDMDICFENYIKQNTKFSVKSPDDQENKINFDKIHTKTKIEILNILSFLLNTYSDTDIISHDITKFILDLLDTLAEKREIQIIVDHIENIFKILFKNYKKKHSAMNAPIKMIFVDLVKHVINKIVDDNTTEEEIRKKKIYFDYLKQFNTYLSNEKNESDSTTDDISNMIMYTIKELIYKNVDNQSFKNPITLRNMVGLTDIDEKIMEKDYIMDLLSLLDDKYHLAFYGFYLKIFKNSIARLKCSKKIYENIKKMFCVLYRLKWIPQYYQTLTSLIENPQFQNTEKLIIHILNYLKDFPPAELNILSAIPDTNSMNVDEGLSEIEEIKKKKNVYKIQMKVMILENVSLININNN